MWSSVYSICSFSKRDYLHGAQVDTGPTQMFVFCLEHVCFCFLLWLLLFVLFLLLFIVRVKCGFKKFYLIYYYYCFYLYILINYTHTHIQYNIAELKMYCLGS